MGVDSGSHVCVSSGRKKKKKGRWLNASLSRWTKNNRQGLSLLKGAEQTSATQNSVLNPRIRKSPNQFKHMPSGSLLFMDDPKLITSID